MGSSPIALTISFLSYCNRTQPHIGGSLVTRLAFGLAAALSLASVAPAATQEMLDVQGLLKACKQSASSAPGNLCAGYVGGIADVMGGVAMMNTSDAQMKAYLSQCAQVSAPASTATYVQAFVAWAEKNKERTSDPAGLGVLTALRDKWPCPRK